MSINKTPEGTWRVRWRENNRQKSKTFKRKVDAEKFEAVVRLGQLPKFFENVGGDKEVSLTFKEMAEIWIRDHAEVHKAPSTIIRDKQTLRDHLFPSIGSLALTAINKKDVVRIQAKLRAEGRLKPTTINNVTGLCHKILSDAVSWGYLSSNPAASIKRINCQEVEHRFWTFDERDRFLTYIKSRDPIIHDIITFAVHTGLRKGEVEGLLRDSLDFDRREIIVKRSYDHKTKKLNPYTKGKKIRRVPMNDAVYQVVKDKRLLAPQDPVFRADFGHIVWRHFKPAQKEAGVSVITFHDLRHTFASLLAMSGVGLFDIQMLLGHSCNKTTMRYMHLAPDHLQGKTDVLLRSEKAVKSNSQHTAQVDEKEVSAYQKVARGWER